MPAKTSTIDEFFYALEALTYREMLSVAGLIEAVMGAGDGEPDLTREGLARTLSDAAEARRESEDEE